MSTKKSKCKKCGLEIPVESVVKHFSQCRPSQIQSANSNISNASQIQTSKKCEFCDQQFEEIDKHLETCLIKKKIDYLLANKTDVKLTQEEYKVSIKKADQLTQSLTNLLQNQTILIEMLQNPIPDQYICTICEELIKNQNVLKEVLQIKQCQHYFHKTCLLEQIVIKGIENPQKFVCTACNQ